MSAAQKTRDHKRIKEWVEKRDGRPACVRNTGDTDDLGIITIDFPGYSGETTLEPIGWEAFFEKFENNDLTFLYQDETESGEKSRFCKLIHDDGDYTDEKPAR